MATEERDDDDAVARLLAEDARAASARYASQGLSALMPRRPAESAARRPNTRFLKNLVRDADSHNAALRRKEESERRARLRQLNGENGQDDRHRKRRRIDGRDQCQMERDRDGEGPREKSHRDKDKDRHRQRRRHHHSSERSYSRSLSPDQREGNHKHRHRHRHRHRHKRRSSTHEHPRSRSRSPSSHRDRRHSNRHRPSRSCSSSTPKQDQSKTRSKEDPNHDDSASRSDPPEELIGPLPAGAPGTVSRRGRGAAAAAAAAAGASTIDTHFSATYDPTLDTVEAESESAKANDKWDMALSAFRDRQKWKQKQTERMREAGFDDDEIRIWQNSGSSDRNTIEPDRSTADLKWGKVGDAREWDRGKSYCK